MQILEAAHQRKLRGPRLQRRHLRDTCNENPIKEIVPIPDSQETLEKVKIDHV